MERCPNIPYGVPYGALPQHPLWSPLWSVAPTSPMEPVVHPEFSVEGLRGFSVRQSNEQ